MLTFDRLSEKLPEESIRFPGAIMTIDVANLTGDNLDPTASVIEAYARLLQGLLDLQTTINEERVTANPPLTPVNLISRSVGLSTTGNPQYTYSVNFEFNNTDIFNNVVDPTL